MKKPTLLSLLCALLCCAALLSGCAQTPPEASAAPEETQATQGDTVPEQTVPEQTEPEQTAPLGEAPVFSLEGNFYSSDILVELTTRYEAEIYYTLDGSEPDKSDLLYTGEGIRIQCGSSALPAANTVKAKAYYPSGAESPVVVHTYFCAEGIEERFTMAVFSISGEPEELTDGPDGIFYGENYENRGRESEREVYLEAWDENGSKILSQYCGVRIYGAVSRGAEVKSMKLYARKSYSSGIGKFHTDIFGTPVEDGSGDVIAEYDKLVLRNAGNDFRFAYIRDELCQLLARNAGYTDYQNVRPVVCFLNGEYYGMLWLHETYCDDYFKEKYPNKAAAGEFVVLEGSDMEKSTDPDDGKEIYAQEFNALYETYSKADLTDDALFSELCEFMDVENYLEYFAFNIFINNKDWPQNNFKCYRYCGGDAGQFDGVYDGKWRFLMHDTDYSFHLYQEDVVAANYNNLQEIMTPGTLRYSPLFTALMQREDCCTIFSNKISELAAGALSPENIVTTLDDMHAAREGEIKYYCRYLRRNSSEMINQMSTIKNFAKQRAEYILRFTQEYVSSLTE